MGMEHFLMHFLNWQSTEFSLSLEKWEFTAFARAVVNLHFAPIYLYRFHMFQCTFMDMLFTFINTFVVSIFLILLCLGIIFTPTPDIEIQTYKGAKLSIYNPYSFNLHKSRDNPNLIGTSSLKTTRSTSNFQKIVRSYSLHYIL